MGASRQTPTEVALAHVPIIMVEAVDRLRYWRDLWRERGWHEEPIGHPKRVQLEALDAYLAQFEGNSTKPLKADGST